MALDETINGELANNNQCRYYSFVPSKTGFYSFEGITNYDFYGELYNEKKERIAFNDNGNGAGESTNKLDFYIQHKLSAGKTYYLMVCSQGANYSGPFAVKVKYVDDYGNDIEHAESIQEGQIKGRIDQWNDVDVFKFIPSKTGHYELKSFSPLGLVGSLYDSNENLINARQGGNTDQGANALDFYLYEILTAGQVYYIKVNSGRNTNVFDSYTLSVLYKEDDHVNHMSGAKEIQAGASIGCSIDYYGDIDNNK